LKSGIYISFYATVIQCNIEEQVEHIPNDKFKNKE